MANTELAIYLEVQRISMKFRTGAVSLYVRTGHRGIWLQLPRYREDKGLGPERNLQRMCPPSCLFFLSGRVLFFFASKWNSMLN